MFGIDDQKRAAKFANGFLDRYTSIGFGALSKREVDLMPIQLLQKHLPDFKQKTDFDAALSLRTTKRKIRGLRDEVSFREDQDEKKLKKLLRKELIRTEVLAKDHSMVMIQLDDAVLRGFAEKTVRSEFGIVDTSFNNAIMQLSGEKFLFLAFSVLSEKEKNQAKKAVREIQASAGLETKSQKSAFTLFKEAFISGAGNQAGKLCVSGAIALISGGASVLLEGTEPLKQAGQGIGKALKKAWSYFAALSKENGDAT